MCGFAGLIDNSQDESSLEHIARQMSAAISHRGPDHAGYWSDSNLRIALTHQRLAILDLSTAGHQPMISQSSRYVIVFNGEIYNHLEIRDRLNINNWKGSSDTETLLTAIDKWGLERTLRMSAGMFAIALWDRKDQCLYLARDRFGEKPLYYGLVGDNAQKAFIFGSELSALRVHPEFNNSINSVALSQLFRFSAISSPNCIFKGINQLLPGDILKIEYPMLDNFFESRPWWCFREDVANGYRKDFSDSNNSTEPINDENEAIEELERLLQRSVSQQSLADVPLGCFLSGGIDSCLITALLQKEQIKPINTFTIGFEEDGFNEAPYANALAKYLGTNHSEKMLSSKDALDIIPKLPKMYSEPFADSSQIPTHLVCREARKAGLKVALSGDGGDELFGGYNRYFWGPRIWDKLSWMPFQMRSLFGQGLTSIPPDNWNPIGKLLRVNQFGHKVHKLANRLLKVKSSNDLYQSLVSEWSPEEIIMINDINSKLLSESISSISLELPNSINDDSIARMMVYDTLNYLPNDILTKVDRAAMSVSLETRAPFLDHRVSKFAWCMPMSMKVRLNSDSKKRYIGKYALRQILYKYVPSSLIDRPKAGFAIPIGTWLRGPLKEWAEDLLATSQIKNQGYLNYKEVERVWKEHLSGRFDHTHKLWSVLMWQAWLEEWK